MYYKTIKFCLNIATERLMAWFDRYISLTVVSDLLTCFTIFLGKYRMRFLNDHKCAIGMNISLSLFE